MSSLLPFLVFLSFSLVYGVTVNIEEGTVIGSREQYGGIPVDKFYGIPFAEPPVGDLRFAPPKPRGPFTEPFQAKRFGYSCLQDVNILHTTGFTAEPLDIRLSEDCLSLSVVVPGGVENAKDKPVLVWIFGGGFGKGTSDIYDLRPLVTIGDVIGVSINYRLGAFGFFSTGDEVAPGNYGLLDQQLGLQWVQRNIRAFGGDPNLVTIFGESAGGASVTAHALAPTNKGLFKRIIAQSGATLSFWGTNCNYTLPMSRMIAGAVGCKSGTSHDIVKCIRKVPAGLLRKATPVWPSSENVGVPLSPRVDCRLIQTNPWLTLTGQHQEGHALFKSTDVLIGINSEDGSPLFSRNMRGYAKAHNISLKDGISREAFRVYLPRFAKEWGNDLIESALWWMYSKSGDHMTIRDVEDLTKDAAFLYPAVLYARYHAKRTQAKPEADGKTYFYHFLPRASRAAYVGREARYDAKDPWQVGAAHAEELLYLFSTPASPDARERGVPDEEVKLAHQLITYWTNFAKTGDPNRPNAVHHFWPEYQTGEEEFLELNFKNGGLDFNVRKQLRQKYVTFWTDVIMKIQDLQSSVSGCEKCKESERNVKDEL